MTIRRGSGGRPSKGSRVFRGARFPEPLDAALVDLASAEGLSISDFIVNAVAVKCNMPLVAKPSADRSQQQELTLKAS